MATATVDCVTINPTDDWNLEVRAVDANGDSKVSWGDFVYLNEETRILSKTVDTAGQEPFGFALCGLIGDWTEPIPPGETRVISVRVCFAPIVVAGAGASPPYKT